MRTLYKPYTDSLSFTDRFLTNSVKITSVWLSGNIRDRCPDLGVSGAKATCSVHGSPADWPRNERSRVGFNRLLRSIHDAERRWTDHAETQTGRALFLLALRPSVTLLGSVLDLRRAKSFLNPDGRAQRIPPIAGFLV